MGEKRAHLPDNPNFLQTFNSSGGGLGLLTQLFLFNQGIGKFRRAALHQQGQNEPVGTITKSYLVIVPMKQSEFEEVKGLC